MKPRFDFDFSEKDYFTALRAAACRRPAPIAIRRFACTRPGVINPPPGPLAAAAAAAMAVAAALRRARLRLVALLPGRPKGGQR